MSDDDLGALARAVAAAPVGGAADAEARLYRLLAPRVRLYGRRHLRDDAAAEDLAQRVLWTTLEKLRGGEIREPQRIASFVLGTSRVMASGLLRGEKRRREIVARFGPTLAQLAPPEEPLPTRRLGDCLERLPERARAVVVMSFYAERPAEEIATELTLSAANVRVIRHRALARLRDCMEAPEPAGAAS